ncbi:MAG: hypothetical protein P4L79_09230 [Legionella sp.]|uniref:hypothetical protein n=1 Tax=Legionella sp. TaxID=459 RepID=UPI00284EA7F2|nr:hypothetical protein [Legionella sp.]
MPKTAYTGAVRFLRDVTKLDWFGWVDDDFHVDAVTYLPLTDANKLAYLLVLPEKIRALMSMEINSEFIRLSVPGVNSHPMIDYLTEFVKATGPLQQRPILHEPRQLNIATVSMPTGTYAQKAPRSIQQQLALFDQHVDLSNQLLMEKRKKFFPDEMAICVMPEFYSHCAVDSKTHLFMPYDAQQELLAGYCKISQNYPSLLIMVNMTANTPSLVSDAEGESIGHKPKIQKTNMLLGIKNGVIVYTSYKLNKGPADIPENELTSSEAERNTYWQGSVDKNLMPLAYFKQFKGVTISGSVCIDAQEGVLGKYLKKQFANEFSTDDFGPAVQVISSSSMALPLFKNRQETEPNQIVTPSISQGVIIQADGHSHLKRSGVWLVDGENFTRQEPNNAKVLQDGSQIESYSINVKLLHNKLHDLVGKDIEEESPSQKLN